MELSGSRKSDTTAPTAITPFPNRPASFGKPTEPSQDAPNAPSTAGAWLESAQLAAIVSQVAVRHGVGSADHPDLLQELRIALWKTAPETIISARWIFTVTARKAVDLRRKAHEEPAQETSDPTASEPDPELRHLLRARTAGLPLALRTFYSLRYREGLSERAIARRLKVCRTTVRHLSRRFLSTIRLGTEKKSIPNRPNQPLVHDYHGRNHG